MASGQDHDKATALLSGPFGLIISLVFGIKIGLLSTIAFVIGGFWLSPDLDTKSLALKRWGKLRIIWWPYRKLIPHRSIFSHGPIVGTMIRLGYLLLIILLIGKLLLPSYFSEEFLSSQPIQELIMQYPEIIVAIFLGLEANVWLHLIQDGDPLPAEWKK